MRKVLGVLVAILALVAGGFGSRAVDESRAKAIKSETRRAALSAAQRTADGLSAIVTDLKLKVENAAANPRMVFALQGNVDERTLRDLWRTEDWWRPWRTEFKVYAVAITGVRLDAVEGIDAADLDAQPLLRRVREQGEGAAQVAVGKGWPYVAAATLVNVPGREKAPVLLLAKPVDPAVLRTLADKSGGAVTLTNGRTSLIDGGPDAERSLLVQAIGSESSDSIFHAADGTWSAASSLVAPGLWLWTFASGSTAAHHAQAAATERKAMLWVSALVLAGVALAFALRRPRPILTVTGEQLGSGSVSLNADVGATADIPTTSARSRLPSSVASGTQRPSGWTSDRAPAGTAGLNVDAGAATAVASTPAALGIPAAAVTDASFGRYTLLDRLGEGGMAEVYTAVTFGAEGFRRKFVIKRLRAVLARDPAAVDQFIDEANLASSMVHSNIVPVFDFGKVGEEYFMAQE
ncbi:MAG: hypothetical protein H7X95_05190, partial [Deltaproteobacteria bacterium]|nr:hypothetical protein [Deltaproteobacteria bacterium]